MKVLYVSCYRDGTGYGHAAVDNILALDAAGVDVVPRPLKLNKHNTNLPAKILELEAKSPAGADYVIQHTLPSMMEYSGHYNKCIAMYCSETDSFVDSGWQHKLNQMDVAWVPSSQMAQAARASGVSTPLFIAPYPCNTSRFEQSYKKVPLAVPEDTFKFYTIGEMGNRRKNLSALIQAFHTEFHPTEPVDLIVKTIGNKEETQAFCDQIKVGLKMFPDLGYYKKEVVISDIVTDDSISRLHATCDCFVLPSYGEAWGIPAFDAMAFGKTPIVTNWGGFTEYVTNENGWLVDCHEIPVFGMKDTFPDLYTGRESWAAVSIRHLRSCMREAYANRALCRQKAAIGIKDAYNFSYKAVGSLLRKELESYEQKNRSPS